ncbi:MAG: DUF1285 domain-containing protein [Pseudomonadales bacterium]|nr:DUF1285 domain-containing protein [Pseudomonadales bacterium]
MNVKKTEIPEKKVTHDSTARSQLVEDKLAGLLDQCDKVTETAHSHQHDSNQKPSNQDLPPVHLWEPDNCGEIDIKIQSDGRWFHEGSPINRLPMVKMFSRILRHDDDDCYYLVTPVEKMRIQVEDVPFVAVALQVQGEGIDQVIQFTTNVGDVAQLGLAHPIRVELDSTTQEPRPYIHVRANLEALISRSVFYELVELAEERDLEGSRVIGVHSEGEFYSLGSIV